MLKDVKKIMEAIVPNSTTACTVIMERLQGEIKCTVLSFITNIHMDKNLD